MQEEVRLSVVIAYVYLDMLVFIWNKIIVDQSKFIQKYVNTGGIK